MENYLSNKTLWYGSDEGPKKYILHRRVPQESVLDTLLWNVRNNWVLALPVPEEVTIVGFVDQLGATVIAKYPGDVGLCAMEIAKAVKS